jgi:hypothetical protein
VKTGDQRASSRTGKALFAAGSGRNNHTET